MNDLNPNSKSSTKTKQIVYRHKVRSQTRNCAGKLCSGAGSLSKSQTPNTDQTVTKIPASKTFSSKH